MNYTLDLFYVTPNFYQEQNNEEPNRTTLLEQLVLKFWKIPANTTFLYIYNLKVSSGLSYSDLARLICLLPPGLTHLHIDDCALGYLEINGDGTLADVFAQLPTVTHLSLYKNNLGNLSAADLLHAMQALPNSVSCLDISGNQLYKISASELAAIVACRPRSTSIDISKNQLSRLGSAGFALVIASLPDTYNNLFNNKLEILSGTELAEVFAADKRCQILDLDNFSLSVFLAVDLALAIAAISDRVNMINFGYSHLDDIRMAELAIIFAAFKPSVQSLNISGNFGKLTVDGYWQLFEILPKSVIKLFWYQPELSRTSDNTLELIFQKFPDRIELIEMDHSFIKKHVAYGICKSIDFYRVDETDYIKPGAHQNCEAIFVQFMQYLQSRAVTNDQNLSQSKAGPEALKLDGKIISENAACKMNTNILWHISKFLTFKDVARVKSAAFSKEVVVAEAPAEEPPAEEPMVATQAQTIANKNAATKQHGCCIVS